MTEQPQNSNVRTRESTLNQYSQHVSRLSSALNERARGLSITEAKILEQRKHLEKKESMLNTLETRMRREMNAFIQDIARRQKSLSVWEAQRAAAEKRARKDAKTALDSSKLAEQLHQRKASLTELETTLFNRQSQLSELQEKVTTLRSEAKQFDTSAKNILKEKEQLNHAIERLKALETKVDRHATEVKMKEERVNEKENLIQKLSPLESVIAPLQLFVQEFREIDRVTSGMETFLPSTQQNGLQLAETAVRAAMEIRKLSRDLHQRQALLETRENGISEREKNVERNESRLRSMEIGLESKQQMIGEERSAVRRNKQDLDNAWRSLEESRKEVDKLEELLRKKEENLERTNQRVTQKENSLAQMEKTLSMKEKSLQRAHLAITSREKALEDRQVTLENELEKTMSMRKAIGLRESVLDVRDLELSTREARDIPSNVRFSTRPLQSGIDNARDDDNLPSQMFSSVDQSQTQQETVEEKNETQQVRRKERVAEPVTVRRQLAFESTRKDLQPALERKEPVQGPVQSDQSPEDDVRDDESEVAAAQLLPELIGARALWRERVIRLQAVVRSMTENQWIRRPHVEEVLGKVGEQLQTLYSDIDSVSESAGLNSKDSLAEEQNRQANWSSIMKQQLDNVREVQTGMLIGLNNLAEDRNVTQEMGEVDSRTETSFPLSSESRNSEDVVDDTLDATVAIDSATNDDDSATEISTMAESFHRFRAEMRDRQRGLIVTAARSSISPPIRITSSEYEDLNDVSGGINDDTTRVTASNRINIATELSTLRQELDSITGVVSIQ